ncbi:MAG: Cobalt/magnesium transport protein CorA [Candidatus Dichloromethanomonas elyunquensis]|nr:MAG: Cobalt/magnesium transport protein CorA [Candidatus Dichloromethanomonas elyunquensis]
MLRILAISEDLKTLPINLVEELDCPGISWYWLDFCDPDERETIVLEEYFHFHHLSIEDAVFSLNRPKMDYYDQYIFLIINALNQETLDPEEISLFIGKHYIVSYHKKPLPEMEEAWNKVVKNQKGWENGPAFAAHQIMDKVVDRFFPAVSQIEDYLTDLEDRSEKQFIRKLIDEVFLVRRKLLKLRRLVNSMRDLLYRIINSERLESLQNHKMYFSDIYDHLLKLSDMIESSRDMTADMRDSYLSINTNRMNTHMVVLTVITTIFIPLTFIVGIYGMNFKYMPELEWKYGYFMILSIMLVLGIGMYLWFKRKGWFDSF